MVSITNRPSSVITGSSTHNERVERLWRDMRKSVTSTFSSTFCTIESEGVLDPLNDTDIFCLHYVYIPRINRCLQEFHNSWNRHSMSSEGNMSPYQMFFEGLSVMEHSDALQTSSNSGQAIDTPDRVEVPRISFKPCNGLLFLLHSSVQPLSACDDFGNLSFMKPFELLATTYSQVVLPVLTSKHLFIFSTKSFVVMNNGMINSKDMLCISSKFNTKSIKVK